MEPSATEWREEPQCPRAKLKRVLADSECSHASMRAALSADTNKLA